MPTSVPEPEKWHTVAVLLSLGFLTVVGIVLALEDQFGTPDPIQKLVKERQARDAKERRDAMERAAERLERWRKYVERKAVMGKRVNLNGAKR